MRPAKWTALTETAVVTWIFAGRTGAVKVNLADTTDVVLGDIPSPSRDSVPVCDGDLHGKPSLTHASTNERLLSSLVTRAVPPREALMVRLYYLVQWRDAGQRWW